jgi:hypothetical protein
MGTPSKTFAKAAEKWNAAEGYDMTKHYDRTLIKMGASSALMSSAGNSRYMAWAADKGIVPDFHSVAFKVGGNEALPVADTSGSADDKVTGSPGSMPAGGDLTKRKAQLLELKTQAESAGDDTLVANIDFELKVLGE